MGVCDWELQEARFDLTSLLQDWLWEKKATVQLFFSLKTEYSGGGGMGFMVNLFLDAP